MIRATRADQDRTNTALRKCCEGGLEIAVGFGIHDNKLQAQRARRRLQLHDHGSGSRRGWVRENAEQGRIGHQLAEQLQSFRRQFGH